MDRLTLNSVSNGSSNFQGTPPVESGATGQVFSRMVAQVGQPVTNHDITDQSTSSDNQRYLNPKKKWLNDFKSRISVTHVVPPHTITFTNELVIYGNNVTLLDC